MGVSRWLASRGKNYFLIWEMKMKMNKKNEVLLGVCFFLCLVSPLSFASGISSVFTSLGGNAWQVDYSVTNDSPVEIQEFSVYFGFNDFSNLTVVSAPVGWDPIAVQPDVPANSDGFFDALALGPGIMPGTTVGGFSVAFQLLNPNADYQQYFEIIDPSSFSPVESGMTVALIPEAETWTMLLAGLGLLGLRLRRRV